MRRAENADQHIVKGTSVLQQYAPEMYAVAGKVSALAILEGNKSISHLESGISGDSYNGDCSRTDGGGGSNYCIRPK